MDADVIHDYDRWPKEEVENSKKALRESDDFELVEVIRKHENLGAEKAHLAIIVYEMIE